MFGWALRTGRASSVPACPSAWRQLGPNPSCRDLQFPRHYTLSNLTSCLAERLEPGVLRPYRHVLQRGGPGNQPIMPWPPVPTSLYLEWHRKITRAFIWRLTEHNMSYKALYDMKCFLTLSALVMLFKAYPTYICFISDILCFLKNIFFKRHIFLSVKLYFLKNIFLKRHIFLSDMLCFLKNIFFFKQHIYVFKKHIDVIEFYRTCIWLVPLNNIYVILM